MTFNALKRYWLATVLAALLAACGGSGEGDSNNPPGGGNPNPPPPTIQVVVVSPDSASVEAGKTARFTAVARDGGGNVVANTTFTWSTSDAAIATIANDGLATGVKAGNVSVRLKQQNGSAVIEVADSGCGMSEQFLRYRLFRPFESTKSTGMGIGTYEVRQYVRELGGRIEVDSRESQGTVFRVMLPLYAPGQAVERSAVVESQA